MLNSLTIQNVVLIERLQIAFQAGLCALTGETGAGKSILLDSLGLALGARSEAGLVRKGAAQASVTAEFSVGPDHPIYALLREQGLDSEDSLILRRVLGADGRSRAFINDQPVSIALLRQAGDLLVEIHGQFETHGLLNPATHRELLDAFARIETDLPEKWDVWKAARAEVETVRARMAQARTEENYLRGAVEDLSALEPKEGEEQKLVALRERLMRREQTLQNLDVAAGAVAEAESAINTAFRALERTGADGTPRIAALDRSAAELQEAVAGMQALSGDLQDSEYDLEEIDERLHALKAQARKHGCAIADLSAKLEELEKSLALIDQSDGALAALERRAVEAERAWKTEAGRVSAARKAAAEKMDSLVNKELKPLKLEKALFATAVEPLDETHFGPHGMDDIRFLVATNPGSAPGPLNRIASGGEMARFMLALKAVLAGVGAAQTLIFDEVDTGIGGAAADAVGERLSRLARDRQVLVVTHSPQVAARAAHHWIVMKDGKKDVTTKVVPLAEAAARRDEIARMLSGATVTEEARAAAWKLLETGT